MSVSLIATNLMQSPELNWECTEIKVPTDLAAVLKIFGAWASSQSSDTHILQELKKGVIKLEHLRISSWNIHPAPAGGLTLTVSFMPTESEVSSTLSTESGGYDGS